jgi:hypothetical protein
MNNAKGNNMSANRIPAHFPSDFPRDSTEAEIAQFQQDLDDIEQDAIDEVELDDWIESGQTLTHFG